MCRYVVQESLNRVRAMCSDAMAVWHLNSIGFTTRRDTSICDAEVLNSHTEVRKSLQPEMNINL